MIRKEVDHRSLQLYYKDLQDFESSLFQDALTSNTRILVKAFNCQLDLFTESCDLQDIFPNFLN